MAQVLDLHPTAPPIAMSKTNGSRSYAMVLWILLALFCLRVLGQMLVAFLDVRFLPPMEEWYSGLMAYRWLLPSQFLIIILYTKISIDLTRGHGFFAVPRRGLGTGLLIFGSVYFLGMVARYVIRMTVLPEERWFGGTIPIFFHWVLASFLLVLGWYHRSSAPHVRRSVVPGDQ